MKIEWSSKPGIGVTYDDNEGTDIYCSHCHLPFEPQEIVMDGTSKTTMFGYFHDHCLVVANNELLVETKDKLRELAANLTLAGSQFS